MAVTIRFHKDLDLEEAIQYRSGQKVALKQRPEEVDTIVEYDPMMVPPIQLMNDPHPRYPEELILVAQQPSVSLGSFKTSGNSKVQYLDLWGRVSLISKSS